MKQVRLPTIGLDGTVRYHREPYSIPEGWTPSPDDPQLYLPPWKPCRHRLLNYSNKTLAIAPICRLARDKVGHTTCIGCDKREDPPEGHYERLHPDNAVESEVPVHGHAPTYGCQIVSENGPKPAPEPRSTLALPKRSRLADIESTLPPFKEGRDRQLVFEPDGSIRYEHNGDEEPPRDINGYKRDPNDPFRFIPLWPSCQLRHQVAVRFANCGCIDVIMRCNNPALPQFADRVKHTTCQECPQRKSE